MVSRSAGLGRANLKPKAGKGSGDWPLFFVANKSQIL